MINLYETFPEALHLVQELEAAGIQHSDITFLSLNGKPEQIDAIEEMQKTFSAASKKGVELALENLPEKINVAPNLQGKFFPLLNVSEVKGLGQVIAAGWLMQGHENHRGDFPDTASIDGLIGSMAEIGVAEDIAKTLIEGIRRGGALVGVWPQATSEATQRIMQEEHRPLSPHMRGHHYWTKAFRENEDKQSSEIRRLLAVLIPSLK
jgi:hypothetical protein